MTRRDTTDAVVTALCISLSLTIVLLGGVSFAVAPAAATNGSADGGSTTQCGTIEQPGNYELGSDITASDSEACLTVTADGVTIDGAGYTIDGVDNDTLSYGVHADRDSNADCDANPHGDGDADADGHPGDGRG